MHVPMFALRQYLYVSLFICSFGILFADVPSFDEEALTDFAQEELVPVPLQEISKAPSVAIPGKTSPKVKEVSFSPFTGKVKGKKVRIRLEADLDSRIIQELNKDEYVAIVGERGDFWAVQPAPHIKAYVFRSFVLDNIVEGNRVNVRLEPHLEAPVIAHMNSGERLENPVISSINNKWFEISPPPQTRFYVAKEYVEYAGGPELKAQADRRLATCTQLLEAAAVLSQAELKKEFQEIDFDRIVHHYTMVLKDYPEFSELASHAKEALVAFQEAYLEKRIAYLESRPTPTQIAETREQQALIGEIGEALFVTTDRMKSWEPVEEALYASWANVNDTPSYKEFYEDQKLTGVSLTGWIEPYNAPTKNKPGDFIIRDKDVPIGYVYSTQINLQALVGKRVTLIASPRSNNNFAFPAYYALGVE